MSFVMELLAFFRSRKKMWLVPLIAVLVVVGALLVFAQNSVIAPLIYTLF